MRTHSVDCVRRTSSPECGRRASWRDRTCSVGDAGKHWACTVCRGMIAARCACGAQRCALRQAPPMSPNAVAWQQSAQRPSPFSAQDLKKVYKAQKVEWIRGELDAEAPLEELAAVYAHLLADKICTKTRRLLCLELYRLSSPAFAPTKKCELFAHCPRGISFRI